MKHPLIGVTPSLDEQTSTYTVHTDHLRALSDASATSVILPYEASVEQIATEIDGLYLSGGGDIEPKLFGEQPHSKLRTITWARDLYEVELVREMIARKKPIFAVCRGAQIVNVALGGDMYQDIYSQINRQLIQHEQCAVYSYASHDVTIERHSLLYSIVQNDTIRVNSRHHQANRTIAKSLKVSATAKDGVVEAIENRTGSFVLGVQWHPENLAVAGDQYAKKLYEHFVRVCAN